MRSDSGPDVFNAATKAVYDSFGGSIRTGSVGHSCAQRTVERVNRAILNMLRTFG